jgi:hypothetical protein
VHGVRCSTGSARARPRYDLADIVRAQGEALGRSQHLSIEQRRVLRDIERCRTAALGGHLDVCGQCGFERPAYNSCRNRHCPKCQALASDRWLQRRQQRLLPTHYFHVVFTLPPELRPLCRRHPHRCLDLLFHSASATLLELGRDPKWLGAQLAVTAVLHTWTRELTYHPHLHCVVSGGGLASDRCRWVGTSPDFLFPVHVASALFRGKFLAGLRQLVALHQVDVRQPTHLLQALYRKSWVVYTKPPFGGPEHVFRYLGRYTHRTAITNYRLLSVSSEAVRFRTRHRQCATLSPREFLRRFVQHVLPPRYVRIRHYGLLASRNATTRLATARSLLAAGAASTPKRLRQPAPDWRQHFAELTGTDLDRCPRCGHRALKRTALPAVRAPPQSVPAPRAA